MDKYDLEIIIDMLRGIKTELTLGKEYGYISIDDARKIADYLEEQKG